MASNRENLKKIIAKLDTLNIPIAYGNFNEEQAFPYMVYLEESPQHISADDKNYYTVRNYRIEYYFTDKNPILEESIEQAMSELDSNYDSDGTIYISSEKCYVIYYYIQL